MDDTTPRTLIDELLAEQQRLTAVERFARRHQEGAGHAQALSYRELIPLERPRAGQQYAFAVDLDACTGCKACVSACHALNGLDEEETWRHVGVLHGGKTGMAYQQTVTTACHHCLEPACLEGCPVMAYDKDVETGIVRHLDDQCIGCQYCVLKCPYDVPKYSARRGIVRKCDLCSSRLAVGEAPACVQACPTQAIRIETIEVETFERDLRPGETLVPGAFDSHYTKPTTSYRTTRPMPENARAGDAESLRLEQAHWPLILMLVLTQVSVGMLAVGGMKPVISFGVLALGLGVSAFHLGRPFGAWRFFLGLRTSWMSREILAFGILAGCAGLEVLGMGSRWLTVAVGIVAIYCSAMIYVDTRRSWWRVARTVPQFFGTALVLGLSMRWPGAAVWVGVALFAWEAITVSRALRDSRHPDHRSAATIWKLQRPILMLGVAAACAFFVTASWPLAWAAALGWQVVGRYFYFTAVVAPRMPGAITT